MQRTSNYSGIGLCCVLIAICFFVSWKFILPKYEDSKGQAAALDNDINAANTKLLNLQDTKKSLDSNKSVVDKVLVAVPEDKDLPNLMTELSQVAGNYQVQLSAIQVADSASTVTTTSTSTATTSGITGSSSNKVTVSFTASGSFDYLHAFMKALENNVKIMMIKNVALSTGDKGLTMSIQLEAYKQSKGSVNISSSSATTTSTADSTF